MPNLINKIVALELSIPCNRTSTLKDQLCQAYASSVEHDPNGKKLIQDFNDLFRTQDIDPKVIIPQVELIQQIENLETIKIERSRIRLRRIILTIKDFLEQKNKEGAEPEDDRAPLPFLYRFLLSHCETLHPK